MSQQAPGPDFNVRGAVDLSALSRPSAPPPGEPGGAPAAGGFIIDVTAATFESLIEQSSKLPVVVLLWMPTDEAIAKFATQLGAIVDEFAGQLLLARVDVGENPTIAQAFQVQGVPTLVAVLGGQPVPLFQGIADDAQIRDVFGQLLEAAKNNGITGRLSADGDAAPEQAPVEEPEPELPPLHQAAYDAIEANDFAAAINFYTRALKEDPRDHLAAAGLANVKLLDRVSAMTLAEVRERAAQNPGDLQAQLDVADLDLTGGKVEDALGRLIELVAASAGDERETVRTRLVDFFAILGNEDPRVAPARRALANALY